MIEPIDIVNLRQRMHDQGLVDVIYELAFKINQIIYTSNQTNQEGKHEREK